MATFEWSPDWQAKRTKKPETKTIKFGDGYTQRVGRGVKSILEEWDLKFTQDSEIAYLADAFLMDKGGSEPFYWTTPSGVLKLFYCEEWSLNMDDYNNYSLSATFKEEC